MMVCCLEYDLCVMLFSSKEACGTRTNIILCCFDIFVAALMSYSLLLSSLSDELSMSSTFICDCQYRKAFLKIVHSPQVSLQGFRIRTFGQCSFQISQKVHHATTSVVATFASHKTSSTFLFSYSASGGYRTLLSDLVSHPFS
jgi:hypothetical protein